MSENTVTTPLAQSETNQCTATAKWFIDKSEYNPLLGTFRLLINGEEAFAEVHRAIAAAKKSVCMICLGFQPSMSFLRGEASGAPTIGQLLEAKGKEGVKIRLLGYVVDPLWLDWDVSGWQPGEIYTPGRRFKNVIGDDLIITSTDDQRRYDSEWYLRYDRDQSLADLLGKEWLSNLDGKPRTKNIHYVGRGFSFADRIAIALQTKSGQSRISTINRNLSLGPSHHQKMVLVDYEDPALCVGFVMGHNTLDEYWDKSGHSYLRQTHNCGRNGTRPREDFSSRVTGPIVGDLFRNFSQAWEKEAGEKLPPADFQNYPLGMDKHNLLMMGQILRTQPQYSKEDIKKCYLQAVNNATQYIYIENQYFRWPPLAEKIKACAAGQNCWGRKPETHGPLYLFVITNADKEGMGSGTVKTAKMLNSLGRADVLPEVSREVCVEDSEAELARVRQINSLESVRQRSLPQPRPERPISLADQRKLADSKARQQAAQEKEKELLAKLEAQKKTRDDKTPILPENRPGLKVHICTLVAPDTPGRNGSTALSADGKQALTREERIKQVEQRLAAAEKDLTPYYRERDALDTRARQLQGLPNTGSGITREYETLNQRHAAALQRRDAAKKELDDLKDPSNPVDWVDVYIHAKLMLIDDTFMTVGSANINTRSMETDSELNISHHRPEITQPARKKLWGLHTNNKSGGEPFNQEGMANAYDAWADVITQNKKNRKLLKSPIASLVEFYSGTAERTNAD